MLRVEVLFMNYNFILLFFILKYYVFLELLDDFLYVILNISYKL